MTPAIQIRALTKTYKNGVQALKGVDLTVNRGDFYALLGPNGAGKTTTTGILSSTVNKTSGEIVINGFDLTKQWQQARPLLGVVPQEVNMNPFETCHRTLIQQAAYYGVDKKRAKANTELLLKQLELWEKRDSQVRTLSGGMKRRLMIARALVHDPEILLLDEPTAGVDIEIRQSMWKFLNERQKNGLTIVLTTHYLEEAENFCNRIAIINHGEVAVECTMRELLSQADLITLVFDLETPQSQTPALKGFDTRLTDPQILEVDIKRGQNLNCIFKQLNTQNISVMSMRNKSNRLEQLFVNMVNKGGLA